MSDRYEHRKSTCVLRLTDAAGIPLKNQAVRAELKKHAKQPIMMKLSPNVTDITEMAKAVEAGGADAISLINTLTGMKIDIERRA